MYRWGRHAGVLELEIEAPSERAVFEEAFRAMHELLGEGEGEAPARSVHLQARDHSVLLADWLRELAALAEAGFIPRRLGRLELRGTGLEAMMEVGHGAPPHLLEKAKYEGLALTREDSKWLAKVVLDI